MLGHQPERTRDIAEHTIEIDEHGLARGRGCEADGHVGRHHGLAAAALWRQHDDDLALRQGRLGRGESPRRTNPLATISGQLQGWHQLRPRGIRIDDVANARSACLAPQVFGRRSDHHHADIGVFLIDELADLHGERLRHIGANAQRQRLAVDQRRDKRLGRDRADTVLPRLPLHDQRRGRALREQLLHWVGGKKGDQPGRRCHRFPTVT